jgi:uncharacterized ion transporter superfamily protein YfcC
MTVTDELPTTNDSLREEAIKRLRKKQDLNAHLLVFALVNAVVWTIWALTSTGFPWPAIVSAFWGVGLVMNIWEVYGRRPIGETDVQREIERLRRH